MEKSYIEIMKLLDLADMSNLKDIVYRGATTYLPDETSPVKSMAAEKIVEIAMSMPEDKPLYVVAIGAITNISSAILIQPEIVKRIVVVWLGGNSLEIGNAREFNMMQDIAAARVLFKSGVPLVMLPCLGVVSHLTTTEPELRHWLVGKNKLASYLAENTIDEANSYAAGKPWSRIIWDVSAIAWFIDDSFVHCRLETPPLPTYDLLYSFDKSLTPISYAYFINRDAIFSDLFNRLS